MSGRTTGWVLQHGPVDRAMRFVLLTIADAANADGRHAHPGLAAIVRGSLYSRSTVTATLVRLRDEGWLEVEEEGRGRGNATVYHVVMERSEDRTVPDVPETSDGRTLSEQETSSDRTIPEGKGPISDDKRSNPDPEKVQSRDSTPYYPTGTTVFNPPTSSSTPREPSPSTAAVSKPASKRRDRPFEDDARRLVDALWDRCVAEGVPRPVVRGNGNPYLAAVSVVQPFLAAGNDATQVARALWSAHREAAITTGAVQFRLNDARRNGQNGQNGRSSNFEATKAVMERMRNGEC